MENVKVSQAVLDKARSEGCAPATIHGVPFIVYPNGRGMRFATEEERNKTLVDSRVSRTCWKPPIPTLQLKQHATAKLVRAVMAR